jgi:hypothetical protein
MKKVKSKLKQAHTSNSKTGMGDCYGIGAKNPIGRVRDVMGSSSLKPKRLSKPPKSLA